MTVRRIRERRPGVQGARGDVLPASHDTPVRLLHEIREHRVDPRDLNPNQRRSLLMLMANGKQTSSELAAWFHVSPQTIRKDLATIRREVGREVREWGVEEVVGQLTMTADRCAATAMKHDDVGLAWSIQRDLVRLLKELGVVGGETQDGVRITVEALGAGYERARKALGRALDPRLTGEHVGTPERITGPPPLPLRPRILTEDAEEPDLEPGLAVPQVDPHLDEAPPA